jgi:opacity protein-like surface antigen
MQKQLLAGAAALAITAAFGGSAALAADMPINKAPVVTKAPPLMDWSGFYTGAHIGWARQRSNGRWIDSSAPSDLLLFKTKSSGILGGIHIGQNSQQGTLVFSWEGDVSAANLKDTVAGFDFFNPDREIETKLSLLASLRARLGMLLYPQTLFFVDGGIGYLRGKITASDPDVGSSGSAKFSTVAPVIGIGVDYRQSQEWSWRVEGLWFFVDKTKHIVISPGQEVDAKIKDVLVARVAVTRHFSDTRLKRDIELLTRRADGVGIYRYRYLWSDQVYVGVMAQEVAAIYPDAVELGSDGYFRVDYAHLGTRLMTWEEWKDAELPLAA